MRVDMNTKNFQTNALRIKQSYKRNQNKPLLFYNVNKLISEEKVPASINNQKIDITYVTEVVKKKLKEMGIQYTKIKNID